jgi:hypothetical protein
MSSKFTTGDIFTQKVDNETYITGRILLNFQEDTMLNGEESILSKYYSILSNTFLIQIYRELVNKPGPPNSTEILFPFTIVDSRAVEKKSWIKTGHKTVLPADIDFPEIITGDEKGHICYRRGEVSVPLKGKKDYWLSKKENLDITGKIQLNAAAMNSMSLRFNILFSLGEKEKNLKKHKRK